MKIAFHVHSLYSYDSISSINSILNKCLDLKIDMIILSDHDTTKGSYQLNKLIKKKKLKIIAPISCEYSTDSGDIIGVNVNNNITFNNRSINHILKQIKLNNGITILPHPFDNHIIENINFDLIDYIEVFNSRSSSNNNLKSKKLAKKLNKKIIYGSDAHLINEISNVIIKGRKSSEFKNDFDFKIIKQNYSNKRNKYLSQIIKSIKKCRPFLFIRFFLKYILDYVGYKN